MPRKRKYVVPILKPEHCTAEYMDSVGLPRPKLGSDAYRWACHAMPLEDNPEKWCEWDFWYKFNSMFDVDVDSEWTAAQFNAVVKAIDPNAKPTGKPYPLKRKKVTR